MKVDLLKVEPQEQDHHGSADHEEHDHHAHHGHGSHGKTSEHDKLREPYRFQMQVFAAGSLGSHYLPKPILTPGLEVGAVFGLRQGKKHFMLGPALQWSRGSRESYGVESHTKSIFAGLQLQFGRSLGHRWTLSGGPAMGLRHLKASDLLLGQGIILDESRINAFEVQGQVRISIRAYKGLEIFAGLRGGHAFYLVDRDSLLVGGFNLAGVFGISLGNL